MKKKMKITLNHYIGKSTGRPTKYDPRANFLGTLFLIRSFFKRLPIYSQTLSIKFPLMILISPIIINIYDSSQQHFNERDYKNLHTIIAQVICTYT